MSAVISVPYRLDSNSTYKTLKKIADVLNKNEQFVPTSTTSFGNQGQIETDEGFLYIAVEENQWMKVAIHPMDGPPVRNTYIQDVEPDDPDPYVWFETNVNADGDFSLWLNLP